MAFCVAWYANAGWLPSLCFLMLTLGTNRRNADTEGSYFSAFSGKAMEIRWAHSLSYGCRCSWGVRPQLKGGERAGGLAGYTTLSGPVCEGPVGGCD